jgi:hypothetical protein
MNHVETLIKAIDDDSNSHKNKIIEAMTLLRKIIDEHEKTMLQQILMIEQEEKTKLEDSKAPLKNELQNFNMQKATFEILLSTKNHAKLLQSKQRFDDYFNKTKGTLNSLKMPTRTQYCLDGLDQLQTITKQVMDCTKYIKMPPYCNAQLEKLINDNLIIKELNLKGQKLMDADMEIVADGLRKSTVRKHFFNLLFSYSRNIIRKEITIFR